MPWLLLGSHLIIGTFLSKLGTGLCHIAYFTTIVAEDQFLKNDKKNIRKQHKMHCICNVYIHMCKYDKGM
jgi:hypothetical protein